MQKAIAGGAAMVNGRPARAGQLVRPGDEISFLPPEPVVPEAVPEEIPLRVIYEDQDLLVIDKPRGLVVHPAAGNPRGTLVNALLAHCRDLSGIGGIMRPGIVHRLDKDTTGLLVVAKNDQAHLSLAQQLKERIMSRTYLALVHGVPAAPRGRLELPVGRHPVDRKRMAVVPGGRPAATLYRVLEDLDRYALLRLDLQTGRTHQIRVHLSAVGHPVVGDRVYGGRRDGLGLTGQALHAARIDFRHPRHGEPMRFQTDPPDDFLAALGAARASAGRDPADAIRY